MEILFKFLIAAFEESQKFADAVIVQLNCCEQFKKCCEKMWPRLPVFLSNVSVITPLLPGKADYPSKGFILYQLMKNNIKKLIGTTSCYFT